MEYQLKRLARSRNIRIRLDREGHVVVSAPLRVKLETINEFVAQSQAWIIRQQKKTQLKQMAYPTINFDEGVVSILGRLYTIEWLEKGTQKVLLQNGICFVSPITFDKKDLPQTLHTWLRLEAERVIRERVRYWSSIMNTTYLSIGLGQQTTRWGSCSGENKLQFNWRLIHFSKEIIDYVVIHELAHTIHHDHSRRFWNVVEKYCPQFRERKVFLKQQIVTHLP